MRTLQIKSLISVSYTHLDVYKRQLVHDAVVLLIDAIERAGEADSIKITAALETGNVKGVTGQIIISKDTHNPEGKDAAIIKIEGDKYVFQQKYSCLLYTSRCV